MFRDLIQSLKYNKWLDIHINFMGYSYMLLTKFMIKAIVMHTRISLRVEKIIFIYLYVLLATIICSARGTYDFL